MYFRLQRYNKKMTYTRVYATFCDFLFQSVGVEEDGDGSVVDEVHLHVGAEAAGFDPEAVLGTEAVVEIVIQGRSLLRACGGDERRTVALAAIGVKRELGYTEDGAAYIADGEVHLPLLVLEHAQVRDLLCQYIGFCLRIRIRHADQQHKALLNFPERGAIYAHFRPAASLYYYSHGCFLLGCKGTAFSRYMQEKSPFMTIFRARG